MKKFNLVVMAMLFANVGDLLDGSYLLYLLDAEGNITVKKIQKIR